MSTPEREVNRVPKRPISKVIGSVFKVHHYTDLINIFQGCDRPVDFFRRYIGKESQYPCRFKINTPIGLTEVTAFGPHDILTINEIFFRKDYGDMRADRVVVDFGSNIGISALFFLTRNKDVKVFCFEPLAQNTDKLKENLKGFEGRYQLAQVAVAQLDGPVDFGFEPTGRYGGVGSSIGKKIEVPGVDSNRVLGEIIAEHGPVDLLKIDIEMLEHELTARITPQLAKDIGRVAIELPFVENPLPNSHTMRFRYPITTLENKS